MTFDSSATHCQTCWRELKPGAQFCGGCGARKGGELSQRGGVKMVLWFFVMALGLMAASMIYMKVTQRGFETVVGGTIALAVLTLLFALLYRDLTGPTLRVWGLSPVAVVLIAAASVPIAFGVSTWANALNGYFGLHLPDELSEFAGHSRLWPIAIIVVLAPLTEELAFRGLIFGGLQKTLTVKEAFIVSSFAFAIMHLSVPTLLTHIPLGLYFCFLRHRSGSIWPGFLAHACHNLCVTLIAWQA